MKPIFGWLVISLLCATPPQLFAQKSPELGRIPQSAIAAAHFRFGSIYAGPVIKSFGDILEKAGPEAKEVLSKRFPIHPFNIDRVTAVALGGPGGLSFAIMVTTKMEVQAKGLGESLGIQSPQSDKAEFPFWIDDKIGLAVPEKQLVIYGQIGAVTALAKARNGTPPEAFADLSEHDFSLFANLKSIPVNLSEMVPPNFVPIAKTKEIKIRIDLSEKISLAVELDFQNQDETIQAELAIRESARLAANEMVKDRQLFVRMLEGPGKPRPSQIEDLPEALGGLFALAMMNDTLEKLRNPPIRREKDRIIGQMEIQAGPQVAVAVLGVMGGLLVPAVQKTREAAFRMSSSNNLKQIGIAIHSWNDVNNQFVKDIPDKKTGKPLLSWRVALLPYLEEDALYKKFKLDEPWDSAHNIQFAKLLPKVYARPGNERSMDANGNGLTHYLGIRGSGTVFEPGKKIRFASITDGTSNTIMVVEAKNGVIWSKPVDFGFENGKDVNVSALGGLSANGFNALFCDGSVRFIQQSVDKDLLKALFTIAGMEKIDIFNLP